MRVSLSEGLYKGYHITGPTHNYLGLRLSREECPEFDVNILPPVGGCSHGMPLSAKEVKTWVEQGLRLAEVEAGKRCFIEYAEAIENDSHRAHIYVEFTRRIIHEFHASGLGRSDISLG